MKKVGRVSPGSLHRIKLSVALKNFFGFFFSLGGVLLHSSSAGALAVFRTQAPIPQVKILLWHTHCNSQQPAHVFALGEEGGEGWERQFRSSSICIKS